MKRIFATIFLCVSILSGCDIEGNGANFNFVTLRILRAEVPESFNINEIHDIEVVYERPNGCTFFEGFDDTRVNQTTIEVVAIGTEFIDGTSCMQAIEEVAVTFQFEAVYTGPYTFRFYSGNDTNGNPVYLEYVVEVNTEPSG